ncbi:MAG: SUKH-4 family immunity protein [Flavobacteriales bacterium]
MTPEEFKSAWCQGEEDRLVAFPPNALAEIPMGDSDRNFLLTGLPEDAAPFLSFQLFAKASLPSPSELFGIDLDLSGFRALGTTGSGDPICLDLDRPGTVVVLLHDEGFALQEMNSSLRALAACLLAYRSAVALPGGILDPWPLERIKALQQELAKADPSIKAENFWIEQSSYLR